MTVRSDHIAGGAAVIFGVAVIALSGELPIGSLSFPGAGLWPKLLAAMMIAFGIVLMVGAHNGQALSAIRWTDLLHALPVFLIAAAAVLFYSILGFIISMALMLTALALLERRPILHAVVYGVVVSVATYWLFTVVLKSPLEQGLLGF